MKDNKQNYSVVVVLNATLTEKDRDAVLANLNDKLEGIKAKVNSSDHLGNKDLVYQIKKQSRGDFWELSVESEKPLQLNEVNLFLNREVNILRYLILKN